MSEHNHLWGQYGFGLRLIAVQMQGIVASVPARLVIVCIFPYHRPPKLLACACNLVLVGAGNALVLRSGVSHKGLALYNGRLDCLRAVNFGF